MGLWNRFTMIFRAKADRALDSLEDPRETLDYSYTRLVDELRHVKRSVVEVTAAKRRLQLQASDLEQKAAQFEQQAEAALGLDREDLARAALAQRHEALAQIESFRGQIEQLDDDQRRLTAATQRLEAKIGAFRVRKEVIKAQYSAAKAQVRVSESVTGISEELADVGYTIQRAEDKTAQLRSRGEAIGELVDTGLLTDVLEPASTPIEREVLALGTSAAVESDLARLKRSIAAPPAPKQLESGE